MILLAGLVLAVSLVLLVRRRFFVVTVVGGSMLPTLSPGRRVLVRRGRAAVRVRRVVVIERPPDTEDGQWNRPPAMGKAGGRRWMIKRVVAVAGDPVPESVGLPGEVPSGFLVVLGDGPRSMDSRHFGLYPVERVLGVVVGAQGRGVPDRFSATLR